MYYGSVSFKKGNKRSFCLLHKVKSGVGHCVVNSNLGNPLWASEYLDWPSALVGWLHNCAVTYIHFMPWEPKLRQRSRGFPAWSFSESYIEWLPVLWRRGLHPPKEPACISACLRVQLLIGCIPQCIFIFCFSLPPSPSPLLELTASTPHPHWPHIVLKSLCWVFKACFMPIASAKINKLEWEMSSHSKISPSCSIPQACGREGIRPLHCPQFLN